MASAGAELLALIGLVFGRFHGRSREEIAAILRGFGEGMVTGGNWVRLAKKGTPGEADNGTRFSRRQVRLWPLAERALDRMNRIKRQTGGLGGRSRTAQADVRGSERAPVGEYWDDNWLSVEIRVRAGGFRGKAAATIITSELTRFLSELRPLFETLRGSAEFATMEGQLGLRLVGDGKGHVELRGEVADQAGIGNRLHFVLQLDQSQLGTSIRDLEKVISEFPVRAG